MKVLRKEDPPGLGRGRSADPNGPIAAFRAAEEEIRKSKGVWFLVWIEDEKSPILGKPNTYVSSGVLGSVRGKRSSHKYSCAVRTIDGQRRLYVLYEGEKDA